MRRALTAAPRSLLALAAAGLTPAAASAQAPPQPIRLIDVSPATLDGPGTVTLRYRVQGGSATAHTSLSVTPLQANRRQPGSSPDAATNTSALTSAPSVGIRSISIEAPATLRATSTVMPALPPMCTRGAALPGAFTQYGLTVPAFTSPVLTVTVDVPRGLRGSTAGVELGHGVFGVPGADGLIVTPSVAMAIATPIKRAGLRPAVTLKTTALPGGRVRFTGKVDRVKTGSRVTLVGRAAAFDANSELGADAQAFAKLGDGLVKLGTTKTRKSGRFSATLKVKDGTAVVARTGGKIPGASCPVLTGS